jgi:hypothetical protein
LQHGHFNTSIPFDTKQPEHFHLGPLDKADEDDDAVVNDDVLVGLAFVDTLSLLFLLPPLASSLSVSLPSSASSPLSTSESVFNTQRKYHNSNESRLK